MRRTLIAQERDRVNRLTLRMKLFWAILTGRSKVETVRAGDLQIDFLDLRETRTREASDLKPVIKQALRHLSDAMGGFGELVTAHLRLLVAANLSKERVLHQQRAYVCRFEGDASRDGLYLACLLIWAAVSSRLARDQEAFRPVPDRAAIRQAAQDAQLRFVKQFPDWEHWADVLQLPH